MPRLLRYVTTLVLLTMTTTAAIAADSKGTVLTTGANRGIDLAVNMTDQGSAFGVLHAGHVQTDMNNGAGDITVAQCVAGLYAVISGLSETDNGKFFSYEGEAMPW